MKFTCVDCSWMLLFKINPQKNFEFLLVYLGNQHCHLKGKFKLSLCSVQEHRRWKKQKPIVQRYQQRITKSRQKQLHNLFQTRQFLSTHPLHSKAILVSSFAFGTLCRLKNRFDCAQVCSGGQTVCGCSTALLLPCTVVNQCPTTHPLQAPQRPMNSYGIAGR